MGPVLLQEETGGNWSIRRKPVMLGRVKLDDTLLTCDEQPESNPSHIGERHMHYHYATSTPYIYSVP